jgi:PqqD family protein of HPr-rel-A system
VTARTYAALPDHALKRVALGGLEAIYLRASGMTHLVAEPLPDLIDALGTLGPGQFASAADIVQLMAERFDIVADDPGEAAESIIAERLGELAALGLVAMRKEA